MSAALCIVLLTLCPAVPPALAQGGEVERAVSAYLARLASAERQGGSHVEEAFTAIASVRRALLEPTAAGDTRIEQMSNEAFRAVEARLRGVAVGRDEVLLVVPEIRFWTSLAGARGGAADRAFFAAWQQTYGDGVWPSYVWQQTDSSGCTAFGHDALVGDYALWTTYRRRFPGRYASAVREEINAIQDQIEHSTCACEGADGVRHEFESYLRRFPSAPNRSVVQQRLDRLKAGRLEMRFECTSG